MCPCLYSILQRSANNAKPDWVDCITMALWLLQCLAGPSRVASGVEFSVFESLKIKCTQSLEPNEVKELIENVRDKKASLQKGQ